MGRTEEQKISWRVGMQSQSVAGVVQAPSTNTQTGANFPVIMIQDGALQLPTTLQAANRSVHVSLCLQRPESAYIYIYVHLHSNFEWVQL